MDSATCAKTFENPWSTHRRTWAKERFIPGGTTVDFYKCWSKAFFKGAIVV